MTVMAFNPAAEMSNMRTQQTLAMQGSVNAAPAAVAPASAAAAAAAAPAGTAATAGAAGDAAAGAAGVQPPPSSSKIILHSVLKGAMTGASVTMGLKSAAPLLGRIGFLTKFMGHMPVGVPPVGKGLLGFLGKIPIIKSVIPMLGRSGIQGFLITAAVGAVVGGIVGVVSGMKKAKAAQAEYAEALAAQQAQTPPPGDPANPGTGDAPAPEPAAVVPKYKSWIIARTGTTSKTGGSFGSYTTKKGDTVAMLAKRFYTTEAEIRKLNPSMGQNVDPGMKLKLKRKVVPNATRWKG